MDHNQQKYNDFDTLLSESEHNSIDASMKERIWDKVQAQQQPIANHKPNTLAFTISKYAAILAIGLTIGLLFKKNSTEETYLPIANNNNQSDTISAQTELNDKSIPKVDTVFIVKTIVKKGNSTTTPIQHHSTQENTKDEVIIAQQNEPEVGIATPITKENTPTRISDEEIVELLASLNVQKPQKKIGKVDKRLQKIIDQPNTQYANSITFKNAIKSF